MSGPRLRFAFRYWEAEPRRQGEWRESAPGPELPALRWKTTRNPSPWYGWDSGTRVWMLTDTERPILWQTASIVWLQEQQAFFLCPDDCTNPARDEERAKNYLQNWRRIYIYDLGQRPVESRTGIYQILSHGNDTQFPFECPTDFHEFLPRNMFQGDGINRQMPCHVVGKLSFVLGLQAMCPLEPQNIVPQIQEYFYRNLQPYFHPTNVDGRWDPRDPYGESRPLL